jgi:hypothetical protein
MNSSTTGISGAGGALAFALLRKLIAKDMLTNDEAREIIGEVKELFESKERTVRGAVDAAHQIDEWLKEFT